MRIRTRPLEASAVKWNPDSPQPFMKAVGSRFIAVDGSDVLVRDLTGAVLRVRPGWMCLKVDGQDVLHFASNLLVWEPVA